MRLVRWRLPCPRCQQGTIVVCQQPPKEELEPRLAPLARRPAAPDGATSCLAVLHECPACGASAEDLRRSLATHELPDNRQVCSDLTSHYQQALAVCERLHGPGHRSWIAFACRLAAEQFQAGRYPDARRSDERTIAACLAASLPADDRLLWDAVTRLGATLDVVGERDGALRLYQELTDLAATTLGPVHPTTAGYLYSRGTAARRLGNHRLAAESFQRALDVWKEVAGRQDDGEKVAAMGGLASSLPAGLTRLAPWDYFAGLSADGLGDALAAMGRVPEARACYRQALACFEAGCGQEGTVDAYYIGELRTKLGRLGESGGS